MLNKEKSKEGNQNHTSHIAFYTSQNGITLIALIITIIVMLILVGVTINVALKGGLFTKASEASEQMQVEADRETLLSAVVAAIGNDGKVVLSDIELPTGWTASNGTYTSQKGNTFIVDEDGKIDNGEEINGTGLVYGKVYKGTQSYNGTVVTEREYSFSKEYGKVFIGNNVISNFIYNENTNTLILGEEDEKTTGTVTKNGNDITIIYNYNGSEIVDELSLTEEESSMNFKPKQIYETGIYEGWYYNEKTNQFIGVILEDSLMTYIEASAESLVSSTFDESYGKDGVIEIFTRRGISIIDSSNISFENNTYTLVETLKF